MIEKQVKSLGCPLGATCQREDDEYIYRCPWYVQIRGKDPQSEKVYDQWACAIAWMPILQIEQSQFERHTAAAVEDFRNVMVQQNNSLTGALVKEARKTLDKDKE